MMGNRTGRRIGMVLVLLMPVAPNALAGTANQDFPPPPPACDRGEFETVVEVSAGALRDLTSKNRPLFQERLRRLKEHKGWSHEIFLERATPFVRDETIAVFDRTTEELLTTIARMGEQGAAKRTPDCALLIELRARMRLLVETQKSKWTYMFEKIDHALGEGAASPNITP